MQKQSVLFIINPKAGVDRVKEIREAISRVLGTAPFEISYAYTDYAGHGTELAREAAAQGVDIVVSVGGDGSLNDVLTGLQGSDTILGIIPMGSGNGLARSVGIPLKLEGALAVIAQGNAHALDLGQANGAFFISNAGVGFDSLITKAFEGNNTRGFKAYIRLIMRHFRRFQAEEWTLEIDGAPVREKAFMITVANAPQLGYNFFIAPDAKLNDGLLNVVIIKDHPRFLTPLIGLQAFMGALQQSRYVTHYTARHVRILNPANRLMQVDGDARDIPEGPIDIQVIPQAVKVLVPG